MADKPSLDEVIEKNWGNETRISKAVSIAYPDATHEEIKVAMRRVSGRLVDEQNEANYKALEEDMPFVDFCSKHRIAAGHMESELLRWIKANGLPQINDVRLAELRVGADATQDFRTILNKALAQVDEPPL